MEADNPYSPPNSIPDPVYKSSWLSVLGLILYAAPIYGFTICGIQMIRTFDVIAAEGRPDAAVLAGKISVALLSLVWGSAPGLIGAILILVSLLKIKDRRLWFFKWGIGLSIVWCIFLFPIGCIIGGPLLFIFLKRKSEFYPKIRK